MFFIQFVDAVSLLCLSGDLNVMSWFPDVQGILFAQPESIRYPMDLVHLWLHESARVYSDKLMEEKDVELFNKILLDTGKRYFEV